MRNAQKQRTAIAYQQFMVSLFFFLLSAMALGDVSAQEIAIGILDRQKVSEVLLAPRSGRHVLVSEGPDTLYRFKQDDAVSVSALDNRLVIKGVYGLNDTVTVLLMHGSGAKPAFVLKEEKEHVFAGDLAVMAVQGSLRLINTMGLERYVAQVVQAEVGYGAPEEFYKIQSVICRTYALRNLNRHEEEGFDLCDHQHCQVYDGKRTATNEVKRATAATSGLVMTDSSDALILSTFHANCGGQTANSEDVWISSRSYLTSVLDTFCLNQRSATWKRTMPASEFLLQAGFNPSAASDSLVFEQSERKHFLTIGSDSVALKDVRRAHRLPSTFFSLELSDGVATLAGRGNGHGVGLCQQGAMHMSRSGYNYGQILGFYYRGVSLVPFNVLQLGD